MLELSRHRRRDRSCAHRPLMLPLEGRALLHGHGQAAPLDAFPGGAGDTLPPAGGPAQTMPLSSAPQLSSRPGAAVKLYLDFTGAAPTQWGSFSVPTTPAYDTDGDNTTFTD